MELEALNHTSDSGNASVQLPSSAEDVLDRSIFVKNVDYSCTQQQLEDHFKDCGQISRCTIRCNAKGQPMGYAYMEFATQEAAVRSKAKTETLLCGRQITVLPKRKNLPRPKYHNHRGGHKMGHPGSGMMNPLLMQGFAMMMAGMQG